MSLNLLFFFSILIWQYFSLLNSAEHVPPFASLQDLSPTFQSSFLSLDRALANNIDDLSFSPKRKRNMLPGALVYGVKAIPAEKSLQMKSDSQFPRWHRFPNRLWRCRQQLPPPPLLLPLLILLGQMWPHSCPILGGGPNIWGSEGEFCEYQVFPRKT